MSECSWVSGATYTVQLQSRNVDPAGTGCRGIIVGERKPAMRFSEPLWSRKGACPWSRNLGESNYAMELPELPGSSFIIRSVSRADPRRSPGWQMLLVKIASVTIPPSNTSAYNPSIFINVNSNVRTTH